MPERFRSGLWHRQIWHYNVTALLGSADGHAMRAAQVTGRITSTEKALLTKQLATLRGVFCPGILVINWHSLGIPAFVASFKQARCMLGVLLSISPGAFTHADSLDAPACNWTATKWIIGLGCTVPCHPRTPVDAAKRLKITC